jgi:hypothetical protein
MSVSAANPLLKDPPSRIYSVHRLGSARAAMPEEGRMRHDFALRRSRQRMSGVLSRVSSAEEEQCSQGCYLSRMVWDEYKPMMEMSAFVRREETLAIGEIVGLS